MAKDHVDLQLGMLLWFNPAKTTRTKSASIRPGEVEDSVKKIGFLSFGHWTAGPGSRRARLPTPSCSPSSWR